MSNAKPDAKAMSVNFGTWLVDRVNVFFRIRRYVRMIAQRWATVAFCTIAATGCAVYLALHSPNIYSASSKIGIAPKIQTAYSSQAQYLEELNNFYDSQLQYMTSSKLMSKVEEKLNAAKPAGPEFSLVTRAIKGAGCFSMLVECTDLDFARRYAQTWAQEFITFKNELRENAIGKSAASTREEIKRYEKSLDRARAATLEFQKKNNIGSVKETGDAAQQRLDKLEAEYQDLHTLRQRLESKTPEEIASVGQLDTVRTAPDKHASRDNTQTPATDNVDPLTKFESGSKYSDLKLQLKTKQTEQERLILTLKPRHPYLQKLSQEIQRLNVELQHQLEMIEEKRQARIKSLKDDEDSYQPLIHDLRQQVLASRNVQYEFERLKEEETNVKTVLDNLRKAEESLNSTTTDEGLFNLIEEGVGSAQPIRPNRPKMILAGLVLGLGLGLGLIYLLGRLDDRMELAEDIENELEEPALGQIPQLNLKKTPLKRPLVTDLEEHHLFCESLRGVRSALIMGRGDTRKQALLMTSAVPGDGKTTFTVNFAFTLALAGHRVLLVDADLRRGDTHNFFGHARDPGLAEVLQGKLHWTDVMQPTSMGNLHVIHTGKLPPNPGELLISPVTREFVEAARKAYDYILFDCPPLTTIDDAFSLLALSDGLIFVVRSGQTSMRFARTALAAVRQRGANILGFVLNGIKTDNPYYYYKHYYHAYYNQEQSEPANVISVSPPATKMASPKQQSAISAAMEQAASTAAPDIIPLEPLPAPNDQSRHRRSSSA